MIFDAFSDVNWLAVLVATVAWFAFSAFWYSVPPLSKAWQREARVEMGREDAPPLALLFIPTLIGYFVTSVVIALVSESIGASTAGHAIALGVTLGVGFGMVTALVNQSYEGKGSGYFLINGLNAVIAFSVVALIVTLWN